jgi:hypothetical protein
MRLELNKLFDVKSWRFRIAISKEMLKEYACSVFGRLAPGAMKPPEAGVERPGC